MSKAKEILEKLKDKVFMTEKGLVSFAPIIGEAIAELEALQQVKSCESCEHWKVRNKLVRSNECFKWSGSVMTPRDFCCNRYEAKEQ